METSGKIICVGVNHPKGMISTAADEEEQEEDVEEEAVEEEPAENKAQNG